MRTSHYLNLQTLYYLTDHRITKAACHVSCVIISLQGIKEAPWENYVPLKLLQKHFSKECHFNAVTTLIWAIIPCYALSK